MNAPTTNCASTAGSSRPTTGLNPSANPNPPKQTTNERPRTRRKALLDVDYIVRVGVVHQRLFSRVDKGLKLAQSFAGSAAVGAAISGQPVLVAVVGGVVALAASVSLVFDFGQAAHRYGVLVSRCTAITAQALDTPDMDASAIDIAVIRATDLDLNEIESLRMPCYNAVLRRHGLSANVKPLTLWQRFWAALA